MLKHLIKDTKEHSLSYGSLPFWSWNDRFEDGELRRQIRNMHDLKMNGFFMHARNGLVTEYLSDEAPRPQIGRSTTRREGCRKTANAPWYP